MPKNKYEEGIIKIVPSKVKIAIPLELIISGFTANFFLGSLFSFLTVNLRYIFLIARRKWDARNRRSVLNGKLKIGIKLRLVFIYFH